MTDHITEQDVELHDDENEIMEAQAHDPKNAEAQSVASVDKAADAGKTAKKRTGDKSNSEPMPKTKAGMVPPQCLVPMGPVSQDVLDEYRTRILSLRASHLQKERTIRIADEHNELRNLYGLIPAGLEASLREMGVGNKEAGELAEELVITSNY